MDGTAALQLFAHLEGEALNVAILMPEGERANWECLSQSLSDYYNSPGRLAVFRWQFESATRRPENGSGNVSHRIGNPSSKQIRRHGQACPGLDDQRQVYRGSTYGAAGYIDISMVFLRILPSETLWIAVVCGRAIGNRRSPARVLVWTRILWNGPGLLGNPMSLIGCTGADGVSGGGIASPDACG